jgi:hypothetical protein
MNEKTTVYTREKLQRLGDEIRSARKLKQLANYYNCILSQVLQAAEADKTMVILTSMPSEMGISDSRQILTTEEIVIYLSQQFPGCLVEAVEDWVDEPLRRGPPTRVLKKGIKIDWSFDMKSI